MNFDSENAFDPLIDYVKENELDFNETMGKMMYMFDDDDVYHYKDKNTREYLKLNGDGQRVGGKW